ncbi:MAG TPA: hypothetical protein VHZ33_15310 [Trebonia sp.]|nr:hypothetical protein [Trebonia sp.]
MAQGVLTGRVLAHGGRHAKTEPYRGRHRKPAVRLGLGTGARVAATVTCVALLVCLPQFRPIWSTRLG